VVRLTRRRSATLTPSDTLRHQHLPWTLRLWSWLAARSASGDPRPLSAPQSVVVLRRR
jgi:hypothetical protein